jgi:hypothetical protein
MVRIRISIKQSDPDPYQIEKPDPYQKGVDPRQCSIFCVLFIGVPTALSLLLYFVIIVGVLCMATTLLLIFILPKILCLFLSPVFTDIVHLGSESCRYAGRAFIFKYSALIVIYFVPPSPPYSPTPQKVWTRVDNDFRLSPIRSVENIIYKWRNICWLVSNEGFPRRGVGTFSYYR